MQHRKESRTKEQSVPLHHWCFHTAKDCRRTPTSVRGVNPYITHKDFWPLYQVHIRPLGLAVDAVVGCSSHRFKWFKDLDSVVRRLNASPVKKCLCLHLINSLATNKIRPMKSSRQEKRLLNRS
jgi:hypothetical protein